MQTFKKLFFHLGALFFLTGSLPAFGAVANVSIVNFAFSPVSTNIAPGDSVIWTWNSADGATPHTSTSDTNGLWDSGTQTTPASFTNNFPTAGIFPYHCTIHVVTKNMRGTITVQAANLPPSIAITNPASGTTLSAPASLKLAASATDSDGTITNVLFLKNAVALSNVIASPFIILITNLTAADYTFSAIASDNGGLTATNSIIVHVVTANPISLTTPNFSPPKNFIFSYSANSGLSYIIQSSTNLFNWNTLQTNVAAASTINFTNLNATNNPAFYRVGLLPNP